MSVPSALVHNLLIIITEAELVIDVVKSILKLEGINQINQTVFEMTELNKKAKKIICRQYSGITISFCLTILSLVLISTFLTFHFAIQMMVSISDLVDMHHHKRGFLEV